MAVNPTNLPNAGHFYSNLVKPIDINLQFTVSPADTAGAGVTSLKSNGYVQNVFMHTSATPVAGNPNPANGYILVQLKGNYNKYIGCSHSITSPTSGTSIKIDNGATLTVGQMYVITTLGNATAAQWTTVGVPAGVTPAVGVAFIATATGAGSGNTSTSRVQVPKATGSGITALESVGSPDAMVNTNAVTNGGEWLMFQCLAATDSATTTLVATAPATGSTISLRIRLDGSSVTVDGL